VAAPPPAAQRLLAARSRQAIDVDLETFSVSLDLSGRRSAAASGSNRVEMTINVSEPKEKLGDYDPTQIVQLAVSVNTPSDAGLVDAPALVWIDHGWY
jgi:hypothetical protein